MKKILTIVCCVMVLFTVSSCTKQYITPNANQTVFYDVPSSAWLATTDNGGVQSYSAQLDVPELKGGFAQFGGVIVSISYDGGTTYEQLPEVYGNLSYSFTYNSGNITLYAQTPDGITPVKPTDPIKVKVILVDSN
ncbi:MAG: hypothetical protein ABI203_01405 [Mucilaginibacter sp.]